MMPFNVNRYRLLAWSTGHIFEIPTPCYPTDRPGEFSTISICSGNEMHAVEMNQIYG